MRLTKRKSSALTTALLLASLAAAIGCGGKGASDDSAARVNGVAITKSAVETEVRHMTAVMGEEAQRVRTNPKAMRQLRERAVTNLIERQLLMETAEEDGLLPSEADVDSEFARVRAQYPDSSAFAAQLLQLDMTAAEIREEIRYGLCIRRVGEKHQESLGPSTVEDARKFYEENTEQFVTPEQRRASHLLVRVAENAPDEVRKAARSKIEGILSEIRGGRPFAEAAAEQSDDPGTAGNGGDLGFFPRGQMLPDFERAAFGLQVGEISDIIETPYGFHILKVTDQREARTRPFEEVQDELLAHLERTKTERAVRTVIDEARKNAKVVVADEAPAG